MHFFSTYIGSKEHQATVADLEGFLKTTFEISGNFLQKTSCNVSGGRFAV